MALHIKEENGAVIFKVRVQPRAAKNQISGLLDDAVKIRLTAPPVDGEANRALQEFVAKLFKVPKSKVEVVSGHTGRNKIIRVENVNLTEARKILPK
ncbi:DUF167 domain-containing protein [Peptococcaceae bacterium 1198_IL3148]